MDPRMQKINRLETINAFDNTQILISQPPTNPNAVPDVYELGTFPISLQPNQPVGAPPSYSQSVSPTIPIAQPLTHVVINFQLGQYPVSLQCPYCTFHIITKITNRAGLLTWLIVCGLALIGCWPFCMIPLCVRRCQDIVHFCPNCQNFLGKYTRI